MATVSFTTLTKELSAHVNAAYEDNQLFVAQRYGAPVAMLIGHDLWLTGQERAVEPASHTEKNARWVRENLKVIRDGLAIGTHTVITVDAVPKAVFVPYEWMRTQFEELGLPATQHDPDCAMVIYRNPRTVEDLAAEFAGTEDPDFEMDRRLSAGPARVPAVRRERLRAVIYVHDGVVVRVRSVDKAGTWEDLPGLHSLAPVSAPMTAARIEKTLPGLGIHPRDKREPRWGTWREYIDLAVED
ncbi:hypothetical protein [Nocardia sp. NBC_01327]|uniref:hypothetical protein n=1 Tax=Nocardia sp. NBC_01327 TaxID=2903593 RepID=UPI002E0E42C3|nr:hypothetical protein OG326_42360 [Nocardia sp. NBC_01327]